MDFQVTTLEEPVPADRIVAAATPPFVVPDPDKIGSTASEDIEEVAHFIAFANTLGYEHPVWTRVRQLSRMGEFSEAFEEWGKRNGWNGTEESRVDSFKQYLASEEHLEKFVQFHKDRVGVEEATRASVRRTITVTAHPETWEKFQRFLAFFHFNGGHSGMFAMPFDGDGHEFLKVEPPPPEHYAKAIDKVSNFGSELEVASHNGYFSYDPKSGRKITVPTALGRREDLDWPTSTLEEFEPNQHPRDQAGKFSPKKVGQQSSISTLVGKDLTDFLGGKSVHNGVPARTIEAIHRFDEAEEGMSELIERRGQRPRYVYTSVHEAKKSAKKFEKVRRVAEKIEDFRKTCTRDLASKDPEVRSNAIAASLIDIKAIRMGGDTESKRTGSIGVSTMRREHIVFTEDSAILNFPGKNNHQWKVTVKTPELVNALRAQVEGKDKKDEVLDTDREDINKYIGVATGGVEKKGSKATGGATAKDFRTFHGTRVANDTLEERRANLPLVPPEPTKADPTGDKVKDKLAAKAYREASKTREAAIKSRTKAIKDAVTASYVAASTYLNNTPTVAKAAYVDPAIVTDFLMKARS